jgi:H+-transporting ATPase
MSQLNGEAEKQQRPLDVGGNEDLGEYGNLVKYISNYRDGRRGSTAGGSTYEDIPKKKWYQFGKKGTGSDGVYETPEEWLTTDWKQGLAAHEVEIRRKKTGWNELTTEKENLFLKFLGFFTGPILYGMLIFPTFIP